jgi:outer membrane protein OmpA-like peptidoglycan-associated protein
MLNQNNQKLLLSTLLLVGVLSGCFHPPYNNFKRDQVTPRTATTGAAVGAIAGSVAAGTVTGGLVGVAAGTTVGALVGINRESKNYIIKTLSKLDIQYISYGDTMTLIVPTDKYFMFDSPRLKEICYPGLNYIVKLLKFYPKSPIYVAAFTDDVGTRRHKRLLTQSQAETMMTFLWANGIQAKQLKPEGYEDKFDIADNNLIHGSALNRRIEIQWFNGLVAKSPERVAMSK